MQLVLLQQTRCKTTKPRYKGQSNGSKPKLAESEAAKIQRDKSGKNPTPIQKPKDPLQGMREANEREREKLKKYWPDPIQKPAVQPSADSNKEVSADKTTARKAEVETIASAQEDHPNPPSPGDRPIPPASPPKGKQKQKQELPPWLDLVIRRWKVFVITFVVAGAGYMFMYRSAPPVLLPDGPDENPRPRKEKALVKHVMPDVNGAISILKEFLEDRCSTDPKDLTDYTGAGIMSIGSGLTPRAIVWPETTKEVEIILRTANTFNVPVIPYSGGTSVEG